MTFHYMSLICAHQVTAERSNLLWQEDSFLLLRKKWPFAVQLNSYYGRSKEVCLLHVLFTTKFNLFILLTAGKRGPSGNTCNIAMLSMHGF